MDTHGPRIMVNVGTQAASNTGLNPRDLAPLTNDAFLATFMGKTALSASNGISRQHNNYRQSYTTQMERVTIRSKPRPTTGSDTGISGGAGLESDTAILSIIRGGSGTDGHQQLPPRQLQGNRNRRRSLNHQQLLNGGYTDLPCSPNYRPANNNDGGDNGPGGRRRRTRSGGQQISVVDQMAAQPHIPYAILPKRFEPKQVQGNGGQPQSRPMNNNTSGRRRGRRAQRQQQEYFDDNLWEDAEDDEDEWLESVPPMMRRRFPNRRPGRNMVPTGGYYGPRLMHMEDLYDPYGYGPMTRPAPPLRSRRRMVYPEDGFIPFDIVPAYDLNEWQGPYARPRQAMYMQRGGPRGGYGRNDGAFLRDDHRPNALTRQSRNGNQQQRHGNKSTTPTRNGKQLKSPKNNSKGPTSNSNGQQKRRNSRQRKQRNQNSKSEGSSESKSTTDETKKETSEDKTECDLKKTTDDDKKRLDSLTATPDEHKETTGDK